MKPNPSQLQVKMFDRPLFPMRTATCECKTCRPRCPIEIHFMGEKARYEVCAFCASGVHAGQHEPTEEMFK